MTNLSNNFNAVTFLDNLFENGANACDSTDVNFSKERTLPDFYDPVKFKCGQEFFAKNFTAMFMGKLLGLTIGLAEPTLNALLRSTKKSGEASTAYIRYKTTIKHMLIWYECGFENPKSRAWASINLVKCQHDNASNKAVDLNLPRITQRDMALAQWGFIGIILTAPTRIGIHSISNKEADGFIHIWRVIGYLLGMDDNYNICRTSSQETKEICELILMNVLSPRVAERSDDFLNMSKALIDGLRILVPLVEFEVFLVYVDHILLSITNNNSGIRESQHQDKTVEEIETALLSLENNRKRILINFNFKWFLWLGIYYPHLSCVIRKLLFYFFRLRRYLFSIFNR